jgi:hypothetical protein
MDFFRRFTLLVCDPAFPADDLGGLRVQYIIAEVEKLGFEVVRARRFDDAEIAVETDAAIGCVPVDWGKGGVEGKTTSLINLIRRRGLEMPIVILVRRKRFEDIPVEIMDFIDGYVFLALVAEDDLVLFDRNNHKAADHGALLLGGGIPIFLETTRDRATGEYDRFGIPAPVVAQFLRENRVVPEKNDLNSLLFLLTPGVESSKAGTLLSTLVAFKRRHDDNAPLDEVIPEFVRKRPSRYSGRRLRDLCQEMHAFYREAGVSALQRAQFAPEHLPTMALPPHEAVRQLVRNKVNYLPIDQINGRIATTLFVVYPPGIATIVPGERLDERARPMLDYLKMFERSANLFPGYDAEIQGIYREIGPEGSVRFHTMSHANRQRSACRPHP